MTSTLHIEIVSAEAAIFSGEAQLVVATGEAGELGIAPRHAPLLTFLKPGHVEVRQADGGSESFYVSGGILEVQPQGVNVLADTAIRTDELDESAAKKARDEAEAALAASDESIDVGEAHRRLAEAQAQLQALERLRRNLKH